MKLTFYGASESVTGSCHILEVLDKKVLLDCGLYQGKDEKQYGNDTFIFNPKDIDYIILSHAHIDHSGRIPILYDQGFRGEIICTEGTKDLCEVMMADSGHIQDSETNSINKKRLSINKEPIKPLYTATIAEKSMDLFKAYTYNKWIDLFDGFKIRFKDAGHLLGSAITEIVITENNKEIKLVYSGDLGNLDKPILKDPSKIQEADYVIMETTYGDKTHKNLNNDLKELVSIIQSTFKQGGNVIIPSFSVGRTQEVLYALNKYVENDILKNIKVFVDSPLAFKSTEIFDKYKKYYDVEASKLLLSGDNPLDFNGLVFTKSVEDSMKINSIKTGAVIISASGMCESGRIKHHLKHNLQRSESSIVFVGYQAEGTLGYKLLHGVKKVSLLGDEVCVNAKIFNLQGLSGHADKNGLLDWLDGFKNKPKNIFLVHGENSSRENFKDLLTTKGYSAQIVHYKDTFIPN